MLSPKTCRAGNLVASFLLTTFHFHIQLKSHRISSCFIFLHDGIPTCYLFFFFGFSTLHFIDMINLTLD